MTSEVIFEEDKNTTSAQQLSNTKESFLTHLVISLGLAKNSKEVPYLLLAVTVAAIILTVVFFILANKKQGYVPVDPNSPQFQREFSRH